MTAPMMAMKDDYINSGKINLYKAKFSQQGSWKMYKNSNENMDVTYLCHGSLKLGKFSTHLHEMLDFQRIPIMIKIGSN